jgi:hypothetical protein
MENETDDPRKTNPDGSPVAIPGPHDSPSKRIIKRQRSSYAMTAESFKRKYTAGVSRLGIAAKTTVRSQSTFLSRTIPRSHFSPSPDYGNDDGIGSSFQGIGEKGSQSPDRDDVSFGNSLVDVDLPFPLILEGFEQEINRQKTVGTMQRIEEIEEEMEARKISCSFPEIEES